MKRTAIQAPTADQLRACKDREAAAALLPAALTRAQLDAIATELGIEALSRFRTKQALVDTIVQQAVGYRLNHDAILNSCMDRPIPAGATNLRPVPAYARRQPTADDLRALTAAVEAGEVADPAVLAELAAAAQALVAVASRAAVSGAANANAASDADDRAVALGAIREFRLDSGWTSIAVLRARLAHLARARQDELMVALVRDGAAHAIPVANLKSLTAADRDMALTLGGQQVHAIQAVEAR